VIDAMRALRLDGAAYLMREGAVAVEREAKSGIGTSRAEWLWLGFKFCDPLLSAIVG
jgi:hypothetical protein